MNIDTLVENSYNLFETIDSQSRASSPKVARPATVPCRSFVVERLTRFVLLASGGAAFRQLTLSRLVWTPCLRVCPSTRVRRQLGRLWHCEACYTPGLTVSPGLVPEPRAIHFHKHSRQQSASVELPYYLSCLSGFETQQSAGTGITSWSARETPVPRITGSRTASAKHVTGMPKSDR